MKRVRIEAPRVLDSHKWSWYVNTNSRTKRWRDRGRWPARSGELRDKKRFHDAMWRGGPVLLQALAFLPLGGCSKGEELARETEEATVPISERKQYREACRAGFQPAGAMRRSLPAGRAAEGSPSKPRYLSVSQSAGSTGEPNAVAASKCCIGNMAREDLGEDPVPWLRSTCRFGICATGDARAHPHLAEKKRLPLVRFEGLGTNTYIGRVAAVRSPVLPAPRPSD